MTRPGWSAALAALLVATAAAGAEPRSLEAGAPAPAAPVPEDAVDALAADDARRPELLLDLALARHAEAEATEAEERRAHLAVLARWRAEGAAGARPALATPRADARRGEAVRLAQRALEEGEAQPAFARAPEALLVAAVDAGRIGRGREALRWLGRLVRRYGESPLAAEGWLAVGEHHLAAGEVARARPALEAAARAGGPELRARAESELAEAAEVALGTTDAEGTIAALERGLAASSPRAVIVLDRLAAAPPAWGSRPLGALARLCALSGVPARVAALRAGPGPSLPPRLLVDGEPFAWRAVEEGEGAAARLAAYAENSGAAALAAGDPRRAEELLARAVAAEPARWRPRLLHARALAALGRSEEALAEAERVLELRRGQADALQLAVGLRQAAGEAAPRLRSRSSL